MKYFESDINYKIAIFNNLLYFTIASAPLKWFFFASMGGAFSVQCNNQFDQSEGCIHHDNRKYKLPNN